MVTTVPGYWTSLIIGICGVGHVARYVKFKALHCRCGENLYVFVLAIRLFLATAMMMASGTVVSESKSSPEKVVTIKVVSRRRWRGGGGIGGGGVGGGGEGGGGEGVGNVTALVAAAALVAATLALAAAASVTVTLALAAAALVAAASGWETVALAAAASGWETVVAAAASG